MTARPEELTALRGRRGPRQHIPIEFEESRGDFGLVAEFTEEEELVEAVRAARAAGYTRMDAFSPMPVEGLAELLTPPVSLRSRRDRARLRQAVAERDLRGIADWLGGLNTVALLTLGGGITGGIVGYLLQLWSMSVNYPYLNVGGRPLNSWPYYLPITYELVILFASFTALFGMILLNGLPRPYHPVFNVHQFARASQDRFFLLIEADDPRFVRDDMLVADEARTGEPSASTRQFLEKLAPGRVYEAER